ncbi:hypothetical protein ACQ3HE_12600 [Plantibacter auratus]|uniref:hypothetical protein n=1 Tax=Plantibacter TaxID=190323 RepID=UPI001780524B|nr:hypothetical protein [Plantibacter sp. CFBP 8798]MBD8464700.1 hypothetical protein [Plantibacter sp. CFBP 8798]
MPSLSTLDELPVEFTVLLQTAIDAEQAAIGHQRRSAFRTTRYVIGALIAAGTAPAVIAALTGTVEGSVRSRATPGGIIAPEHFALLARIPSTEIRHWADTGLLPALSTDAGGTIGYPAEDLVRALHETRTATPDRTVIPSAS